MIPLFVESSRLAAQDEVKPGVGSVVLDLVQLGGVVECHEEDAFGGGKADVAGWFDGVGVDDAVRAEAT